MWSEIRNLVLFSPVLMSPLPSLAQSQSAPTPASPPMDHAHHVEIAPPDPALHIGEIPPPTVAPVAIPPAEAGLDLQQQRLADLEMQTVIAQAQLKLMQTTSQAQQLQGAVGKVQQGIADVPELVSISGGSRLAAEFRIGARFVGAWDGDWLTPEWRVVRVSANGVELLRKNGQHHTALLGQQPVDGATPPTAPTNLLPPASFGTPQR